MYHEDIVTGVELIDAITTVFKDERYQTLKYWIGDRTGCTEFLVDSKHAKSIAELNKKESLRNPGLLLALVAPKDLEFGMSRMYQIFAEDALFETVVFRSRDAADEWIRSKLA